MNAYERIVNACCGDVEQAELIAQELARVAAVQGDRAQERSLGDSTAVVPTPDRAGDISPSPSPGDRQDLLDDLYYWRHG